MVTITIIFAYLIARPKKPEQKPRMKYTITKSQWQ